MSVKYFDKEKNKWVIFPGTVGAPGKDAYLIAQENGYTGTKEEYIKVLLEIPNIINSIENTATENSNNLITSGGTWKAVNDLSISTNNKFTETNNKVNSNTTNINRIDTKIVDIINTDIPSQIAASIVNDLNSLTTNKSLSAAQGKVLKEMIGNLVNLQLKVVDSLPTVGEPNIIYLTRKEGSNPDVHDEFVYIDGGWEKIGNTEVDLSSYYTKQEVDSLVSEVENKIPTIPDIITETSGTGNVITDIRINSTNKHKINANKSINVYTKQEIDDKTIRMPLLYAPITEPNMLITTSDNGEKEIKATTIRLSDLALKANLTWNSITGKPSTYTPSAHTHVLTDITNAGLLAGKDKVEQSDLNFNIPENVVIDSVLSTTSENPVQNKVITTQLNNKVNNTTLSSYVKTVDLNTKLEDYYLKTQTYNRTEIDNKIASAGGGDVLASGNFTVDHIILGAGTKSIKDSGVSLSSLATQTWVSSQNYLTNNTLPIATRTTAGIITTGAQDFAGEKTFYGGIAAQDADLSNLIVSNSLSLNGELFDYKATSTTYGGLKVGYTGSLPNIPLLLDNTGKAYVKLTTPAIMAGLGGINGKPQLTKTTLTKGTGDITIKEDFDEIENIYNYTLSIPEIPIALPNPYTLSIRAGGVTSSYNGNVAVPINLDSFYSKKLTYSTLTTNAGYGGYITLLNQSYFLTGNEVYSEDKPDSVIVVPYNYSVVTTGNTKVKKSDGFDDVTATSGYKCYCFTRITDDLILANIQVYS